MFGFLNASAEGKLVETSCGSVKGIVSKSRDGRDFHEWRGIPYAKPPIGLLRFASPRPFGKWEGVRDGSKFGPTCPQVSGPSTGDEDCLNLNVAVPKKDTTELLPVMVFIHGGAFQNGSGSMYLPEYFMDEDVVLVTLNYRLGVLGGRIWDGNCPRMNLVGLYVAGQGFLNTGDSVIRGNMGLKDQRLALRWVKDNIQSFGGNPNQITIFRESAGGCSVHHLVLSPSTHGLFVKAISQSGVALPQWACESTESAVKYTHQYAKRFDCDTEDSEKIAECLRSKSVAELLAKYEIEMGSAFRPEIESHFFMPSIEAVNDEDAFLVEHALEILAQGKAQRVPWMVGVNADEGLLISMAFYKSDELMEAFEKNWNNCILWTFGATKEASNADEIVAKTKELYFPKDFTFQKEQKLQQFTKLFSDSWFNLHSSHAISVQSQFSPVYPYYFSRQGGPSFTAVLEMLVSRGHMIVKMMRFGVSYVYNKIMGNKPKNYGVCHFDETALQFRINGLFNIPKNPSSADYMFSKEMVQLWVDFAKDDTTLEFKGVPFLPQVPDKPLQYFEICESPKLIDEPFADRTNVLKSVGLIQLRIPKAT